MPSFHYIKLGTDIFCEVEKEIQDNTWLIFPTERSCKEALKAYQQKWQPINVSFLSMDQFKQKVIFSNQVNLQDEKRLVCLYQAMSQEDREIFHIEKYPDLIDWGQHFFSFFEELAEETVDADELLKRMENYDFTYQVWQLENYTRMLQIRKQYQSFIFAKGYSDAIFDKDISNLHLPSEIKRYVFVNQFYYTKLERVIIEKIESIKCQAIIYYQGSPDWLNEQTLRSRELNLEEAFPNQDLPIKLSVFQSPNAWQMALAFLKKYSAAQNPELHKHFIIDAKFLQQPYHKAFSSGLFQYSEPCPMHKTTLSHFFQIMAKGLENLVYDKAKKLIKLDWLLQAIGMNGFIAYFRPDWNKLKQDSFTAFVCNFSEKDVLYLDLELEILKIQDFKNADPECVELLKEILALVSKLSKVNSIRQLIDAIDVKDGIEIIRLLSEDEQNCSTLQESFYEGLANFLSMDELALVEDWQALYPNMEISAGILDLFMTFIKPKTYRFYHNDTSNPSATITNLMDTRNLQADKVTFLNLVEGDLPSGRTPVWLFNEKQRKAIGLKTWDDIRSWERYYYYRLIASAKEVEIYTVNNQDKDVEPSSFLNELFIFAEQKSQSVKPSWQEEGIPAPTLLKNWLKDEKKSSLAEKASASAINSFAFYNIPFDKVADFDSKEWITLSWSACEHFLKNPFLYYLRDLKKLKERIVRQDETLGRKMFGTLLHHYLNAITKRLAEQHQGILSMKWEWINKEFLTNNLKSALNEPLLFYQIPKNYNWEYLRELMSPFLIDTASWFFHVGLAKEEDLQSEIIKLIPETDTMTKAERQYKPLIQPEENEHQIGIGIRGRADLRLETTNKRFIIDFKTGDFDWLQIVFYMWSYYLIDNPEMVDSVRGAFYKLMDKQMNWFDHKAKPDPYMLKAKLIESLSQIGRTGYAPATDTKHRRYYIDITRADLMHNMTIDEEEE